jgi:hypothetical protein
MTNSQPFVDWTPELRDELSANAANAAVGTRLLLEDEHARHWEIRLAPGEIFTTIEYLRSSNPPLPLDEIGRAA